MSDQVSVLVETLSGIYVHYFDCKICFDDFKDEGKVPYFTSHFTDPPPPPPLPPPAAPPTPSLSITAYFHGYLFKAT